MTLSKKELEQIARRIAGDSAPIFAVELCIATANAVMDELKKQLSQPDYCREYYEDEWVK